jgi:hypothetical protein
MQLLSDNRTDDMQVYEFDSTGRAIGRPKADMWLEGVAYPMTIDYEKGLVCFYTHSLGRCVYICMSSSVYVHM